MAEICLSKQVGGVIIDGAAAGSGSRGGAQGSAYTRRALVAPQYTESRDIDLGAHIANGGDAVRERYPAVDGNYMPDGLAPASMTFPFSDDGTSFNRAILASDGGWPALQACGSPGGAPSHPSANKR